MILSWARSVHGAPSSACIYRTSKPLRSARSKVRRYGGDENWESLEGVHLGGPPGAVSQILKVRNQSRRSEAALRSCSRTFDGSLESNKDVFAQLLEAHNENTRPSTAEQTNNGFFYYERRCKVSEEKRLDWFLLLNMFHTLI